MTDDGEVRASVGHQMCLDGVKVLIKKSVKLSIMQIKCNAHNLCQMNEPSVVLREALSSSDQLSQARH